MFKVTQLLCVRGGWHRSAESPEAKRTLCLGPSTEHLSLSPGRKQRKSEGSGAPGTESGRQASALNLLVHGEQRGGKGCKGSSRACWLGTLAVGPAFLGPDLAPRSSEQVI